MTPKQIAKVASDAQRHTDKATALEMRAADERRRAKWDVVALCEELIGPLPHGDGEYVVNHLVAQFDVGEE